MKKLAFAILIAGVVFALSQCFLFDTTVEYRVTSASPTSVTILYNDENGEGARVDATTPWSLSFDLYSSERPFAAALRATNNDLVNNVNLFIYEDGVPVDSFVGLAPSFTADTFAWIE